MLRRFRYVLPLICIIFLNAQPAHNQRTRNASSRLMMVHGVVRHKNSNTPAENILVRLEDVHGSLIQQVATDRSGKFQFSGLEAEQYRVVAHSPGFAEAQQEVDLTTSQTAYVLMQIVPDDSSQRMTVGVVDARVSAAARHEFDLARQIMSGQPNRDGLVESVRHLEKAIKDDPAFFDAQLMLGTVYMDLGNWQKAETALNAALKIDEKSLAAHFALAETLKQQKKLKKAEGVLQKILLLDNKSWYAHYELARVYWEMGDIRSAGPEVARALQLKPDYADGYLLAGNILLRAHQAENALAQFEEYLRLSPDGKFAVETRAMVSKIKQALSQKKSPGENRY